MNLAETCWKCPNCGHDLPQSLVERWKPVASMTYRFSCPDCSEALLINYWGKASLSVRAILLALGLGTIGAVGWFGLPWLAAVSVLAALSLGLWLYGRKNISIIYADPGKNIRSPRQPWEAD